MSKVTMRVDLPASPKTVAAWAREVAAAADRAEELTQFARHFFARHLHNYRRVDGSFVDGPMRRQILRGSAAERARGLFVSDDDTDDGSEFSQIRPYSLSCNVRKSLVIARSLEGGALADPERLPYQAMIAALNLAPAEQVFVVRGASSAECALFCFPVLNAEKPWYLLVQWGGRYNEQCSFFFDGDLDLLARDWNRRPRFDEIEQCAAGSFPDLHRAPISFTRDNQPARRVMPEDLSWAMSMLHDLGFITGA